MSPGRPFHLEPDAEEGRDNHPFVLNLLLVDGVDQVEGPKMVGAYAVQANANAAPDLVVSMLSGSPEARAFLRCLATQEGIRIIEEAPSKEHDRDVKKSDEHTHRRAKNRKGKERHDLPDDYTCGERHHRKHARHNKRRPTGEVHNLRLGSVPDR